MPKNIIIFSDGTGQSGGRLFDEPRSNIYKLYRATRCGPDAAINPAEQLTFYDAGIGTKSEGPGSFGSIWRWVYNIVSQALGMGLTGNIIDCYAALVRMWTPGDRIFLIGFSRGAYTVRCLAGVIAQCGIPTVMENNQPLKRDMATSKQIAKEAVKRVYQHTPSRKREKATERQKQLLDQRQELAERFRAKYGSGHAHSPNVFPHFIGVFDTVASLSSPAAVAVFAIIGALIVAGLATICWWLLPLSGIFDSWLLWVGIVVAGAAIVAGAWLFAYRVRWEIGLKNRRWWQIFHLLNWRMKFYDMTLNENVGYARHALAIDEAREAFDRVPWGTPGVWPNRPKGQPEGFQQVWFAGNHSDIGGSYPENESRLSDISLGWMADAAKEVGLKCDDSVLQLYPDASGMQHDETREGPFKRLGKIRRSIVDQAPLHDTVIQRFEVPLVLQYDLYKPYRPDNLRNHQKASKFYTSAS